MGEVHLVDFDNLYGRCVAGDDDRVASLVCHLFLINRPLLEAPSNPLGTTKSPSIFS
jgi:hypothetical protein